MHDKFVCAYVIIQAIMPITKNQWETDCHNLINRCHSQPSFLSHNTHTHAYIYYTHYNTHTHTHTHNVIKLCFLLLSEQKFLALILVNHDYVQSYTAYAS